MAAIKFGLHVGANDLSRLRRLAPRLEALGYYSLTMGDHLIQSHGSNQAPQLEIYSLLSTLATTTRSLRLGAAVGCMAFRNPALLAKTLVTLDHISEGRIIAGLGAGWLRAEHEAFGYAFPPFAERVERLREGAQILKLMWTQAEPTFHGRHYHIDGASCVPKPFQSPHPPILIGGTDKRLLRVVAEVADIYNTYSPDLTKSALNQRLGWIRQWAQAAGRGPDAIQFSAFCVTRLAGSATESESMARALGQHGLVHGLRAVEIPDPEAVRNCPGALVGTAAELKREIRARSEELDLRYFIINVPNDEMAEEFGRAVIPEFA